MAELIAALASAPAPPVAAARPEADRTARLSREGEVWSVRYAGRTVGLRDTKGLHHLAALLARPGKEVHALDLVAGPCDPASRGGAGAGALTADGLVARGSGDLGPRLDAAAERAYRARAAELQAELDEARAFRDPERAARAREELAFLARELSAAVGLHGRARPTGSDAERARVNVTRAIRAVLSRLAQLDPEVGAELDATVRTGTFCVHRPDPRRPVLWSVSV